MTLFAVALVLVSLPFGFLLKQVVDEGPLTRYDRAAAQQLHEAVREVPAALPLLHFLSFLGKPIWFYVLAGAVCLYLWRHRLYRLIGFIAATGLIGGLVDTAVKVAVSRPRPQLDEPFAQAFGKSFPSGHAFTSTVVYGTLLLVFFPVVSRAARRWLVAGYVFLVVAISFSRLALGVHYVTDVVGGVVLGAAWLLAATSAFSIWRVERGRPAVKPLEGVEPESAEALEPGHTAEAST